MANLKYSPRSGTTDYGKQYETVISTYLSLRLCFDDKVKDFYASTNNKVWGDFDDAIFEIEHETFNKVTLAIQLKHTTKNVTVENLTNPKGDYSLDKYLKSYEKIRNENNEFRNVHFLLYTTGGYSEKINEFQWRGIKLERMEGLGSFLDNFQEDSVTFQFVSDESSGVIRDFLSHFFVYTNQKNCEKVIRDITELIAARYSYIDDICEELLRFVTNWCKGHFGGFQKLTKSEMALKLAELLLMPYMAEPSFDPKPFRHVNLWNQAVKSADVTIISDVSENDSKIWWSIFPKINFRGVSDPKFWLKPYIVLKDDFKKLVPTKWILEKSENDKISLKSLYIVSWKSGLVPLFLKCENSCKEVSKIINFLSRICPRNFVIATKSGAFSGQFSKFENLLDLQKRSYDLFCEILEKVSISVQNRFDITLEEMKSYDPNFLEKCTPDLFLEILENAPAKKLETAPELYIERSIYEFHVHVDVLKFIRKDAVFVFCELSYHYEIFTQLFPKRTIDFTPFRLFRKISNKNIFLVPYGVSVKKVRKFARSFQHRYHTFVLTEKDPKIFTLKWVESTASIDFIRKFQTNQGNLTMETDLFEFSSRPTNVISDPAGMGKSTLLAKLFRNCPNNFWAIKIDLTNYLDEIGRHQENPANYFFDRTENYGTLTKICFKAFSRNGKVVLFIDGFDEVPVKFRDKVLAFLEDFRSRGFKQWIATRPATAPFFEQKFNVLPSSICPFTHEDQENYIETYARTSATPGKLVEAFWKTAENWDASFNGVPLHLKLLTEALDSFLLNHQNENDSDELVPIDILQLYESFVDMKFSYSQAKFLKDNENGTEHLKQFFKRHYKPMYQIASIITVFGKEVASNFIYRDTRDFLAEIRAGEEKNGIIVAVSEDNVPIFGHRIFAEFFAASWLAENWDNPQTRQVAILLFEEVHAMVRIFFDKILAKKSPIVRAVLDQDLKLLQNCSKEELETVDEAGRTALHLACSRNGEAQTKIVAFLLEKKLSPQKKDAIFGLTPVQYADKTRNVKAIEKILAVHSLEVSNLQMCSDVKSLVFSCIMSDCVKVLAALRDYVNSSNCWTISDEDDDLIFTAVEHGNSVVVKLLLGINEFRRHISNTESHGNAALQLALMRGNMKIAQRLLDVAADYKKVEPTLTPYQIAMEESTGGIRKVLEEAQNSFQL